MQHEKKRQKIAANVLLWGFLGLLLLPFPLWALVQGKVDTANYENRPLASFPQLVWQSADVGDVDVDDMDIDMEIAQENAVDGAEHKEGENGEHTAPRENATTVFFASLSAWPAQFEAWLGDHAPFRNQFMSLNARMNWLFGALDSSDVLLGKENWLFLKDVSDSKSLSDYQGITSYSSAETAALATQLVELQTALQAKGSTLVVLFAPAKEGVYAQYMPSSIPIVGEKTRVQALCETLAQSAEFAVVFPQEALIKAQEHVQVYYQYDTHWNEAGAWVAAQSVFASLGMPHDGATAPEVIADTTQLAPTDLADMSALWALCEDDVYYTVSGAKAQLVSDSADGYITAYAGDGTANLLLVRDSFGAALAPILAQPFAHTLSLHGNALSPENLTAQLQLPLQDGAGETAQMEQGTQTMPTVSTVPIGQTVQIPEVVVLEVGERFSDNLLRRAEILCDWLGTL